jgi:outer membrane protein assembly factor BamD
VLLFALAGCTNKKAPNPIANVDSKQPDKVLFDRAMDALKHKRFDTARMTLQTLINTYPDSEFVARAKLSVADSWYAEGGSAALAQAEAEYNDFKTFFPNMPEAAEAQMKIANIHYQQMEKADRDFTHAKRAEEAYREMIQEFPDSQLVPQAKEKLREVQEVLAEREFLIGRFYYLRFAYPAAIARLQSLADAYPLYSNADEALFLLGDSYEKNAAMLRNNPRIPNSDSKQRIIKDFENHAADAYSHLLTRYPLTARASEAKRRLVALHRPVPKATAEAVAQNKAEEQSRGHASLRERVLENFTKHPDTSTTAKVGDPTLVDPRSTDAPQIIRNSMEVAAGKKNSSSSGPNTVSIETSGTGTPPPNEPTPRSDTAPASSPGNGISELTPVNTAPAPTAAAASNTGDSAPAPPPSQLNQAAPADGSSQTAASGATDSSSSDASNSQDQSSSKQKKKKGLHKLIPF